MYISGKIFMKIWSAAFVWLGASLLVFGGGMRSIEDFLASRCISGKNFTEIQSVVIKILGELLYPWALAEVCALRMIFKM